MRVADWMSPDPITVAPFTSVRSAEGVLRRYQIRHLPVVERDQLVGMVSDRDVLGLGDRSDDFAVPDNGQERPGVLEVSQIMSRPVQHIGPDEPIEHAAHRLLTHRISALPVVDAGGQLVGLLTTTDCLLALLEASQQLAPDA